MAIRLSDDARRYLAAFEAETGVAATDCLIGEVVTFVVPPEHMATAIGPNGRTVNALESTFDERVVLVEGADDPATFVANALAPAAVYGVSIRESDEGTVAVATVDEADMGVAIGRGGVRIERARRLAARHFGIEDVEVRSEDD